MKGKSYNIKISLFGEISGYSCCWILMSTVQIRPAAWYTISPRSVSSFVSDPVGQSVGFKVQRSVERTVVRYVNKSIRPFTSMLDVLYFLVCCMFRPSSSVSYDHPNCRSRWPRGLRRGSAATRLLGMRVRIPPRAWISLLSVVCFQVEVSATGRSLVQRSPTDCGVSEYDREASIMKRPWPRKKITILITN